MPARLFAFGFTALLITAAAGIVGVPIARADSPAGVQISPDGKWVMINKDVNGQRWAITLNTEDQTASGNVFLPDGSDPQFVWCETTQQVGATRDLSCWGAPRCLPGPCPESDWASLGSTTLPESFFHPPGTALPAEAVGAPAGGAAPAAAGHSTSGARVTRDGKRRLISKDVNGERWAISYDFADRSATGNVFQTGGGPPLFVWCRFTGENAQANPNESEFSFECNGADRCASAPCDPAQWTPLGTVMLPGAFFADAVCGDGASQPGEDCDDGNIQDDDGCSADCKARSCNESVTQIIDARGDGSHPLALPLRVGVDSQDKIYVLGDRSKNVFQIAPDGTILEVIDRFGGTSGYTFDGNHLGFVIDAADNLLISADIDGPARNFGDAILRLSPDGVISKFLTPEEAQAATGRDFRSPRLSRDREGNIYIADSNGWTVHRVRTNGTIELLIDQDGDGAGQILKSPRPPVVDGDGNVYVAGYSSANLFRIERSGAIAVLASNLQVGNLDKIQVDDSGRLHVLASGRLYVLLAEGEFSMVGQSGTLVGSLYNPRDVIEGHMSRYSSVTDFLVTPGGELYVAYQIFSDLHPYAGGVYKVSASGEVKKIIEGDSRIQGLLAIDLSRSGDIVVSGSESHNAFVARQNCR